MCTTGYEIEIDSDLNAALYVGNDRDDKSQVKINTTCVEARNFLDKINKLSGSDNYEKFKNIHSIFKNDAGCVVSFHKYRVNRNHLKIM